ncbi:hypothetical protein Zm00014a_005319 [Zea mays]|uniref:CBS domain-containing protein CBSCBSPB5 n=1 Tax=Zea mays TaxID=4577 RepID=A0A3L6FMM9_MAIZE|nr:CBS domain-containing protein CBSCBSPB5 [Zea mays]PWZ34080.1 hypothetical protein Zm00014a_005319 [Zea mays]
MDGGAGAGAGRRNVSSSSGSRRRVLPAENGHGHDAPPPSRRSSVSLSRGHSTSLTGERTVKRLRLSKALTIPDHTTVHEACRRMASRRVDAVLLTDSNALLCGILTDKDITTRVIARELKMEETPVSKVMTRNPVFVLADTLAVEALQKMVQGKFRHLPVVENGEVIAILDIAKCLYDAIARMERAAEKGKAIAAAVEGVEKHWGAAVPGTTISRPDSNYKPCFDLYDRSRDILMRVIAQNLPPESTTVEKASLFTITFVMTQSPECATVDTPILDALHTMHDGKFLHLPVLDRDGNVVTVVDVLHITHAAIATVGNSGAAGSEATSAMMQRFWDSAMSIGPIDDDDDSRSEGSTRVVSEATDIGRAAFFPASGLSNTFGFKIQDKQGRMHRFNCETSGLAELITSILQRVGDDIDRKHLPQILYEDEDRDKVVLSSDSDLVAAVDHARKIGWKSIRLHLDYAGVGRRKGGGGPSDLEYAGKDAAWASAYSAVAAGAALVAGLGVMAYLKRSG